jgi:ATP-dependent DNA helicase RecG
MEDKELLKVLLDVVEWETFDCKRASIAPSKLLESVVAFANTSGGTIALGLEDSKKAKNEQRLLGISENLSNIAESLKLIEKEIAPPLKLWGKHEIDITNTKGIPDKILFLTVGKGDDVHSLKNGDTFVRKGDQTVKIGAGEIVRLKYEKGALKFEDEAADSVSLDDLDGELLNTYMHDTQSEGKDNWQFLKDNGLALKRGTEFVLTKAGVLLFGKNPSVLLKSKCGVKISNYFGTKPNYSPEPNFLEKPFTVEGSLLQQIDKVVAYFRDFVKRSRPKLAGSKFVPTFLVPEWVFQEAVTNAIIHRNYSIQDDIQIRFFDDRVEIESPGTYPGHITVRNMRSERFARNPLILRTLNRFQSSPNLDIGEGVDRMFKIMFENNLYEPLYLPPASRPHSVMLVLINLQRVAYWNTVSKYLDVHVRITNTLARKITGISDTLKMSRLLTNWVDKGLLKRIGSSKKSVYYTKSGEADSPLLFSSPSDNKKI